MPIQTEVKINSIDVSSKLINYIIEKTYGDAIASCDLEFTLDVDNITTISVGNPIIIKRGWTTPTDETIYQGFIESVTPSGGKLLVTAKDKLWLAIREEVTQVYDINISPEAGVISDIFSDLVTTYVGLNADSSSIQDSGTIFVLDRFVCNHTDVYERLKALAETLDWQFYYRPDTDKVYFEPKGFTSSSTILTVGTNVLTVPQWEFDTTEMMNDITVIGAYQEIETTETGRIGVTSGYTTTSIDIDFEPISVKVYADASNPPTTLQVGGLPDSTTTYFYYVDKENKQILPAISTTFTSNHYFEIRYSHAVPIPVHMYSQSSIDSYGYFKKTITFDDIRTVADAEARGVNKLGLYSQPFVYTTLKVKPDSSHNFSLGQIIRVIDNISKPNQNRLLNINRIRLRYPNDYDEIDVGDKRWRMSGWQESVEIRLKRVSEDLFANQDLLTELISIDNTSTPINVSNRYVQAITQDVITEGFVLGSADFGILGTDVLGPFTFTAEALHYSRQNENIYTEEFIDNDFKDTSTTATWNTTNKELTFTSGQIAQSKSIDYNNSTITQAKLTATIDSGTFLIQMTADGTNYETVTNGVTHTFTNTGTDLQWKITENATSTGKITKIVIEDYH